MKVGLQAGAELPGTDPLVVRAAAGYRLAVVAGIPRRCAATEGDWVCTRDGPADLVGYLHAVAHVPNLEVAVDFLGDDRSRGLGAGLAVGAGYAWGRLPAASTLVPSSGGDGLEVVVADDARAWQAASIRALLHLTLAL